MSLKSHSFSLQGKVALITSGAQDLGQYHSITLSLYGVDVFVVTRSESGWAETKNGAAERIIKNVVNRLGKLDLLDTNAGIQIRNKVLGFTQMKTGKKSSALML